MITETQILEKKLSRTTNIVLWLFAALMVLLVGEILVLTVTCWNVVHHH
jgi:hypothetical protein